VNIILRQYLLFGHDQTVSITRNGGFDPVIIKIQNRKIAIFRMTCNFQCKANSHSLVQCFYPLDGDKNITYICYSLLRLIALL
jgi:hypothetical protein